MEKEEVFNEVINPAFEEAKEGIEEEGKEVSLDSQVSYLRVFLIVKSEGEQIFQYKFKPRDKKKKDPKVNVELEIQLPESSEPNEQTVIDGIVGKKFSELSKEEIVGDIEDKYRENT